MKCPDCQFENLEGANFCSQCGISLSTSLHGDVPAKLFGDKLARIQRYLPQGLTQKVLGQRDRIEGERRFVTVMFCDMEGFTLLVEHLGAEDAYAVMDQVYEILIRQVHSYEGTTNEMTGDGIMALFGAPIALEEAPQRALWAAHAIHREIALFNGQKKGGLDPIRMRIGINTGPVVVGTLGNDLRVEFKAVGDTVNLASRIESLAEPGTTYVTQEVYDKTREMFAFESLGKKVVKGWPVSIPVYKVLPESKSAHRPRLGSERMFFSEMVGRRGMLEKLELQVMKLVNGAGSIINLIGEAGIGKSRLLAELKRCDAMRRVTLLEGQAISMGRNLSFHPVIDLLKRWAQIELNDGMLEAFTKLETAVRNVLGQGCDEVLPFVATLMGLQLPPTYKERLQGIEGEALEKLIRKSMRELFACLSAANPLVIVMDDLHWSDESSIELMESLFRIADHERILFINLFRPDHGDTGQRILATLSENQNQHTITLDLKPLDDRESEALIANMLNLRGVRHSFAEQIIDRAGGNPYFLEEVVRSLLDQGAVAVRREKLVVEQKLVDIRLPDTINDVLMARIDRLEEETRELIKVASVIGRKFFYQVLSEVAGHVRNLDEKLCYLKETQLIQEHRRKEGVEYFFSHALAQEAAYATILPEKRKSLHAKVAETIEKVFADKLQAFYGMLAYHYSRAENLEKTEETLIKAGETALKTSASSEALHYYLEALNLYRNKKNLAADASNIALLEKNIALALYNRGQYEEAITYFDRSLNYYWGRTPRHLVFVLLHFALSFFHLLLAFYLPALKFKKVPTVSEREVLELYYKKCQALVIVYPRRWFFESFYFYRRFTQFDYSKFQYGVGVLVSASSMFTFTGLSFGMGKRILAVVQGQLIKEDARQMITYDVIWTTLNYFEGKWKSIKRHDDDLVERNLSVGEVLFASLHYYWHGFLMLYQGDMAATRWIVSRLSEISEVYENDSSLLFKYLLNAALLMERRHFAEAISEITAGVAVGKKNKSGLSLLHFYSCLAQIRLLMGHIVEAENAILNADAVCSDQETVPWMLSVYFRSQTTLSLYRLKEAIANAAEKEIRKCRVKAHNACRALLQQTKKVAQHRTEAYRLMGEYRWLTGRRKAALKWWRKSIRNGAELGARIQLSRTYFEIGRRLREPGSPSATLDGLAAQTYIDKAETLFTEMNLEWDLARLRGLPEPLKG